MSTQKTLAVIGAGNRGQAYGQYILDHPGEIKVVAVAEPRESMRQKFAAEYGISAQGQFSSWEELLGGPRLADAVIISTPDDRHVEPALKAMSHGYTLLLEKPIATSWEKTLSVAKKAKEINSTVFVCHVLRYTTFYQKMKSLLQSGIIGPVRYVNHTENVGYYHFAHSYVRGNWRNTAFAAPVIVAKSCHDMDILHWLLEKKCTDLFSFGSLRHFTKENWPAGASERCVTCHVETSCPYSARKIYKNDNTGWPVSVITTDFSPEGRYKALAEGPYGRCVYQCDNNVPDVQTVAMKFEDSIEVVFSLVAFSPRITRETRICGTKGEIWGDFEEGIIKVTEYGGNEETIRVAVGGSGHGGGDHRLMEAFTKLLRTGDGSAMSTSIENSMESHIMAFAAEESRLSGKKVNLDSWRSKI